MGGRGARYLFLVTLVLDTRVQSGVTLTLPPLRGGPLPLP